MCKTSGLNKPFLPNAMYRFLFGLLGVVYLVGLFVPLMDNDAAHHAIMAMRMHLTGDYISLYDYSHDYLDKPHLLFWLSALSYKLLGVNTVAYKLPSLLFTTGGVYSVYRLGKKLYGAEAGKLAALMIASAFAFILSNNDVRMDAILTACIAFSTWQLVEMVDGKSRKHAVGAAIGLALGFSTKGHIAVFTPALACFFYMLSKKDRRVWLDPRWILVFLLFFVFILPELYAFYMQFTLHPEKVVRGKDHIDGVRFILFGQSVERFTGEMGHVGHNDRFFFFHSFLWAFAPWSIIAFIAFIQPLKEIMKNRSFWITHGVFAVMLVLITLSEFKLPHYLNILFPFSSLMAAVYILRLAEKGSGIRAIYTVQMSLSLLILLVAAVADFWIFPVKGFQVYLVVVLLLALVLFFFLSASGTLLHKAVLVPVATMVLLFFLLNLNFYPVLLNYQGGNTLAFKVAGQVKADDIYFEPNSYSPSFNFYMKTLRRPMTDSIYKTGNKVWVFTDKEHYAAADSAWHFRGKVFEVKRYWITRMKLKFLNPATREDQLTRFYLAEVN